MQKAKRYWPELAVMVLVFFLLVLQGSSANDRKVFMQACSSGLCDVGARSYLYYYKAQEASVEKYYQSILAKHHADANEVLPFLTPYDFLVKHPHFRKS